MRSGRGDRGPAGKEGFLSRQRRKLIHADFREREIVLPARYIGTSLADYRRAGRVGQFFKRLWALLVVLVASSWVLSGVIVIGRPLGWLADVGGAAFVAAGAYLGLYYLAGWRCMRRHRRRPRRKG